MAPSRSVCLLILEKPLPLFNGHPNQFILINGKHPYCSNLLSTKFPDFSLLNSGHPSSPRVGLHGALFIVVIVTLLPRELYLVSVTNIFQR